VTFIDPRAKVLRHLDRLVAWDRGETPAPVTVEWDLSNRCSLGCQDCHFAHTHSRGPWAQKPRLLPMAYDGTGDLAHAPLVMRGLTELAEAGVQGVIWSGGGEPTLHPAWQDCVQVAHDCGLQQGMYTLGGHFTVESARHLATVASFVVVSLDAADADTYAQEKGVPRSRFQAACDGVVHLVGHRAAIGLSFLLHAKNWMKAADMHALARMLGATYATFRPAIQFDADRPAQPNADRAWVTDALPMLDALARESDVELAPDRFIAYRDWQSHGYSQCTGIRLNTTITPDGRVWLCPNRRGVADSLVGDLRVESFADLWARHPRAYAVNDQCRVMCRLHTVNTTLDTLAQPRAHEAFL
jgi:MoaA/NifB/PqqE/SkfB family radical SAM enzyme